MVVLIKNWCSLIFFYGCSNSQTACHKRDHHGKYSISLDHKKTCRRISFIFTTQISLCFRTLRTKFQGICKAISLQSKCKTPISKIPSNITIKRST